MYENRQVSGSNKWSSNVWLRCSNQQIRTMQQPGSLVSISTSRPTGWTANRLIRPSCQHFFHNKLSTPWGRKKENFSLSINLLIHNVIWQTLVLLLLMNIVINVTYLISKIYTNISRPSDHYFHSVCWLVCLFVCAVFLSRVWSDFDQTWTCVVSLGLVVSPRI